MSLTLDIVPYFLNICNRSDSVTFCLDDFANIVLSFLSLLIISVLSILESLSDSESLSSIDMKWIFALFLTFSISTSFSHVLSLFSFLLSSLDSLILFVFFPRNLFSLSFSSDSLVVFSTLWNCFFLFLFTLGAVKFDRS